MQVYAKTIVVHYYNSIICEHESYIHTDLLLFHIANNVKYTI